MRRCWICVLLVTSLAARRPCSETAHADPPTDSLTTAEPDISTGRRTAAVLAAIVPGVLVRGTGSWVVHERRTAKHLAALAAIGLGAVAVGGLPIALTGANPYSIAGVPLVIAGTGLFATSWFSDLAVAAGARGPGTPRAAPPWSVELGTVWLRDPYRQRGLVRAAGTLELGRIGLGAGALVDAEGASKDGAAEIRVRIRGAEATGAVIRDGSRLVARAGLRVHRDDDDRVTLTTGEAELRGRLDLAHIDRVLDGTFVDLSAGIGIERARYTGSADNNSLLLGGFAWGIYLGERGEATLFYDNRRDSLAGGLPWFHTAGFVGSFGTAVDILVAPRWAVHGGLEVGNAWVTTLAVRYHGGGR